MAYTTINKSTNHFNTITWTGAGNSAARSFTGVGFQPDWVWYKCRTDTYNNNLVDSVRGAGADKELVSNSNVVEGGGDSSTHGYLSSFDSDGFSSANGSSNNLEFNQSGDTFVAWNWKANGQGSSNTDGSINTTYTSVNTTAGFSISSFTGTGANATVGHGLGVAPKVIITKSLANAENWGFYHESLGNTKQLNINTTSAVTGASSAYYNNTSPTSTVFSVGTADATNDAANMIAYCFAEKTGYSKFGSFTGNGNADGPFVYTGFKPAFVLLKRTDSDNWWHIFDNKRDEFNLTDKVLYPNKNNAEATAILGDMLSNGFKLRQTDADVNGSSASYIYMAFAEEPLVANVGASIPATAR